MKILAWVSTLDLGYNLGCTPHWWQLLKAFREEGHEVIAVPYLGDPVESLWWRTYENPTSLESKLAKRMTDSSTDHLAGKAGVSEKVSRFLVDKHIRPTWESHIDEILEEEGDVDLLLMLNIPLNHITGIPTQMKEEHGVQVAFFEGDAPTILPQYAKERGFRFSYYEDADLSEYDAFFTNSKGVIPDLEKMGAKNVHPIYWGADPELFKPADVEEDVDVAFYGHGNEMREEWMRKLITLPSQQMEDTRFLVGGKGFDIDLGSVERCGVVPYAEYSKFVGRARINLNITRSSHTTVYASATARPFELAAYGACIVSQPYAGIEEWFTPEDEIYIAGSTAEACEIYRHLLDDPKTREQLGRAARHAILDRHTYHHRVDDILGALA